VNPVKTSEKEQEILRELLRDSKQSDREIAGKINVSQPTVTRIRSRLERQSIIRSYTAIPNLRSMGYEIVAVTFFRSTPSIAITNDKRVLFASHGLGFGKCFVLVSVHRNFSEMMAFLRSLEDPQTFLISTESDIMKSLSFSSI